MQDRKRQTPDASEDAASGVGPSTPHPTNRDLLIVEDLVRFRRATVGQVARRHFRGNEKLARRRLLRLWRQGIVRRFGNPAAQQGFRAWTYAATIAGFRRT